MSFINDKTKEINCKIIYFGPAQSGKSTSLRFIYNEVKKNAKGEMISLAHDNNHTLYFDFVPINLGKIKDYSVRLHLYTVPGEVGYKQSRLLISKGIDGVVFVADSQLEKMDGNLKSLTELKKILEKEGHTLDEIPIVYQYNKRDKSNAVAVTELRNYLNKEGNTDFETIATKGTGVYEAFKTITAQVLKSL